MVSRRKNYRFADYSDSLEYIDDIGDALLFKGRQHNHWRENMHGDLHKYWTLLFHFVPDEFDFVDFKVRGKTNGDI